MTGGVCTETLESSGGLKAVDGTECIARSRPQQYVVWSKSRQSVPQVNSFGGSPSQIVNNLGATFFPEHSSMLRKSVHFPNPTPDSDCDLPSSWVLIPSLAGR